MADSWHLEYSRGDGSTVMESPPDEYVASDKYFALLNELRWTPRAFAILRRNGGVVERFGPIEDPKAPRFYLKRADGKVYAGRNRRGAVIFIRTTASDYRDSRPLLLAREKAELIAAALGRGGHPVSLIPPEELHT